MYLVFDIGRTNTRIAVSQDGKNLDEVETTNTLENFPEAISSFKKIALKLTKGQKITKAVGGVRRLNHPTIPLWVGEPLKETLEKSLETAVYLENDSALAGLAEATVGAGKGKKIVAYITVSTGIGGVRIVSGKIDANSQGFEPGNQIINLEMGQTLESYISGDAIQKKFNQKAEQVKDSNFWDDTAKILAIGLNNTIVFWSPDVVVLGGSVTESILIDKVKLYLKDLLQIYPQIPEVVRAGLGDKGGLLGCLAYLNQL